MTEFGLIAEIQALFKGVPTHGFEGIGDDCAIFPISEHESLIFTTDMLVEDVHFLRNATTAKELGGKSLAVNLSDIAAMGGTPIASMLSLSLPKDCMGDWAKEFMEGYHELSLKHGTALVGGDTTGSKSGVVINVTAIGRIKNSNTKRRSDAVVGDIIFVSDKLGASGAGLKDILNGDINTTNASIHRNPSPQIEEGHWLADRVEVHAMMDISDGIASDLRHIMKKSNVGVEIELNAIPTDVDIQTAATAGEDYKLLFTVTSDNASILMQDFEDKFGHNIYQIGQVTNSKRLVWTENGVAKDINWQGFRHY